MPLQVKKTGEKNDLINKDTDYKNINKIKFTISFSPSISKSNFKLLLSEHIIKRLKSYSDKIHDINFTCHIKPFMHDAHGVYLTPEENEMHLRQMIELQRQTGIAATPVFNDIYVPNTYENLKLFVLNFYRLYEMGIRSITVPHVIWMKMGLIQKSFPDLKVKNTVLRRVRNGQDFWNHAEVGFDYINLDRVIIRDRHSLKEIREAQKKFFDMTGKYVFISMLEGEGCLGFCPLWEEHYQHTLTHPDIDLNIEKNLNLFRLPQSLSCLLVGDSYVNPLISVGLPFFRDDLNEVCEYFDIIKLAGRRAFQSLSDNLKSIEKFYKNDQQIFDDAPEIIKNLYINQESNGDILNKWRNKIKNCRFQCWNCNMCSEIIANMT